MTKEHIRRKEKIGHYALPYGSIKKEIAEEITNIRKKDPEYKKFIKKQFKKAVARVLAQKQNGTNYPMDTQLRYFLEEYNNRNFNAGVTSLPSNFNVMEAFFEYDPVISAFLLQDETDHLFSLIDFFDYYTSPGFSKSKQDIIDCLEENVIHSYNNSDSIGNFTISTIDNEEYVIAGTSIVRDGNEISCLILCGKKCDTTAETNKLLEMKIEKNVKFSTPEKQNLKIDPNCKIEAVNLLNNKNYWQCLALARLDLDSSTIDVEYLLMDQGISFATLTNDLQAFTDFFGEFESEDEKEMYHVVSEKLQKFNAIFEVAKALIYLPVFFNEKSYIVNAECHPTKLGVEKDKPDWRNKINLIARNHKVYKRELMVLPSLNKIKPSSITTVLSNIKTEVTGFWKTLPYNSVGRDKNGNVIHGRTWVQKSLSWVEENIPAEITIKNEFEDTTVGINPGYIYLMRNAAHDKDIFKIGLTRRGSEVRSTELSKSTSSPDKFLIAQDWQVKDCVLAEKLIHENLADFRINPSREFFKGDYKIFFNVIHGIVEKINGNQYT